MFNIWQTVPETVKTRCLALNVLRVLLLVTFCMLLGTGTILATEKDAKSSMFEYSIAELLEMEVGIGTLANTTLPTVPASITTIRAEDIAVTPARDILDLLEVYVPGSTFVEHFNGPRFCIRGIQGDQNSSFLLLVNGVNRNLLFQHGPFFEIQNRDLSDIERIEIIRGPGSVTHGPGAIGGVINIVTKDAKSDPGWNFVAQGNEKFNYLGLSTSYGYSSENLDIHLYGSYNKSQGLTDSKYYYIDRAHGYGYGFMGPDWGTANAGSNSPPLYDDYRDKPQIKADLNITWQKDWQLHARYVTSSMTKIIQESSSAEGPAFRGNNSRAFAITLQNTHALSDLTLLKTRVGFSSGEEDNVVPSQAIPLDDIAGKSAHFAENRAHLRVEISTKDKKGNSIAAGGLLDYQYYTAPWGMDEESFVAVFPYPMLSAVYDRSNPYYLNRPDRSTVIGHLIDGRQYSLFGEANIVVDRKSHILVSARGDNHEYADWAFSPRLAYINQLNENNTLKGILQRSVRLPAFSDMFAATYYTGESTDPEILNNAELIVESQIGQNWLLSCASYYSRIKQLSYTVSGGSRTVGKFELIGLELDLRHQISRLNVGVNYSLAHQLSWQDLQGIDAYVSIDDNPFFISDYFDNRMNNLPAQTLKTFANYRLKENFKVHANGHLFWQYGQNDMLEQFQAIHQNNGNTETHQQMADIYNELKHHGYGDASATINVSFVWEPKLENLQLQASVFATNLVSVNRIRPIIQFQEGGSLRQYPRQISFLKEPRAIGMRLQISF